MKPNIKLDNILHRGTFVVLFVALIVGGCKKTPTYNVPIVGDTEVSQITDTSVVVASVVLDGGSDAVVSRGVVWDNTGYPTINSGTVFNEGEGIGSFTIALDILQPSVHYYIRGYATNSVGTSYGTLADFWTTGPPRVKTGKVKDIIGENATLFGIFLYDGKEEVEELGLCWGTDSLPSVEGLHVALEMEADSTFSITVSELLPLTTYFVRAYAKSIKGLTYGDVVEFNTFGSIVTDIDGNVYETVNIGQKMWMSSNLRATHYNNGVAIEQITDAAEWSETESPAWSYFDNNIDNAQVHGILYNWYAIKEANLCPDGWRVATDEDWEQLDSFLTPNSAFKLKSFDTAHWITTERNTNTTNFSATGSGSRDEQGKFVGLKRDAMWWVSNEYNNNAAWMWETSASSSGMSKSSYSKRRGAAIRCVRDFE